MKKNFVLIPTILLLMWFFLDMIGISFNNTYLVSRSFGEDGVFFIIYFYSDSVQLPNPPVVFISAISVFPFLFVFFVYIFFLLIYFHIQ